MGVKAQVSDRSLADHYYAQNEFDKAQLYYEKLHKQNPATYYYQRLRDCYFETESYDELEKLLKDQTKDKNSSEPYIDLGRLYEKLGDTKKSEKSFEKAIDNLPVSQAVISLTGRLFTDYGYYTWAEKTYLKGRELLNNAYPFAIELANLYGTKGETEKMIDAYLDLSLSNPIYKSSSEAAFLRYLDFTENEENSDLLRKTILKKIQQNQSSKLLTDMLIWYFYQTKNFNGAFTQLKALAKRGSISNDEFLGFARICTQNNAYKEANMAYDYLAEKGADETLDAEKALSYYKELENTPSPDDGLIERSNKAFKVALNNPLKKTRNAFLFLKQSDFALKFQQNTDSAIFYLDELLSLNTGEQLIGNAKLQKADILLIENEIWDAALLYGQVDKAFKNDVLGFEAKFRNAKIAYYTGDFEWAKAQLNILKLATSKLISNDAIKLSLLITDNLNQDTTGAALTEYAQAELLTFQRKYDAALLKLDSISFKYPGNSLADEILYEEFEIALEQKNYTLAESKLLALTQAYSTDIFGDNAYYQLGLLYEEKLNQTEKALLMYETLLKNYPGSLFIVDARKRFRNLRGDS